MINYASYEYTRDNEIHPMCWQSPNNLCMPHFHSSIEFVYIIEGELSALIDSRTILATAGDCIVVPSYSIHSYTPKTGNDTYVLTIPLNAIPSYKTVLSKKTFASNLIKKGNCSEELLHCMNKIMSLPLSMHDIDYTNILKGYSYIFVGHIITQIGLTDISFQEQSTLAQDILIYIQNNFLSPLTLPNIATHFGYSVSRFSHIFSEYFGCNLSEYINGLRCRHAIEQLQKKNITVTEVALASGFESTRTFYRAFKKVFHCTPMQYYMAP